MDRFNSEEKYRFRHTDVKRTYVPSDGGDLGVGKELKIKKRRYDFVA